MRRRRFILAVLAWFIVIALAACLDRSVANFVRNSGIQNWILSHHAFAETLKAPGTYYFTIAIALLATLIHPLRLRAGGFLLLATLVSGINGLVKWIAGRTRPFKLPIYDTTGQPIASPFDLSPFRGGFAGVLQGKNLCFPSGHAALAFATAAALALLWPRSRWRWLAFAVATLVALERVAENAHWLSDCVAAAALGVGGVHLIHWMLIKLLGEPTPPRTNNDAAATVSSA